MTNLFFLRGLVSTARKCLLAVLRKQFTPVVERTVSNTQIARDLTHRLPAGLYELYRFDLKFPCIRSLCLLHDPCPFRVGFTLPSLLPSLLRVKTKPFQTIRQARHRVEEGRATLPLPFQHTDLIPFVNRDARTVAEVELQGREVTMHFTLWDKRNWVLHHPERFSESTRFAAKAGRDAYDQAHNGFFVQFDQAASDLLWFGDLVEQRVLRRFTQNNATTAEYQKRWRFARQLGFSNGCFCTRPGVLSPADYWFSDGALPGDLLFEPEALYRGILYGAALA